MVFGKKNSAARQMPADCLLGRVRDLNPFAPAKFAKPGMGLNGDEHCLLSLHGI